VVLWDINISRVSTNNGIINFPPYAMYVTVDRVMAELELNNKVCESYTEVPMPTLLIPEEE